MRYTIISQLFAFYAVEHLSCGNKHRLIKNGTHRLFPQGLLLPGRQPPSLVFGGGSGRQRFTVGKLWGGNQREGSAWLLRDVAGMRKLEAGPLAAGILCDRFGEHTWPSLISSELEVGTKNQMLAAINQALTILGGLPCQFALAPSAGC